MELDRIDRIDNIDTLRGLAKSFVLELQKQEQRIARLEAQIKDLKPDDQLQLQLEIDALKQQLANRNKVIFGTSSEKRPLDKPKQPKQPQTGHGPTEQVGPVTVLHLNHHGSRTSSNENYLEQLQPEVVLISEGVDNDFGHPHLEIMQRLQKRKIPSYQTEEGIISILSNGNRYEIDQ